MAASDIDWTDQKFLDAINAALTATAKCRGAFKTISQQLGANTVTVPVIAAGSPLSYGPDQVESTLQLSFDLNVDEQQHAGDLATVTNLISVAACGLGALEDTAILEGAPAGAGVVGRKVKQPALPHGSLALPKKAASTPIGAVPAGSRPKAAEIVNAVSAAMASLENANRPGTYSLILQNELVAILNAPVVAGGAPAANMVSTLVGGNTIVGTSALDRTYKAGKICGVLFRYDPAAVDLVQTQLPALTVLGKTGGITNLRIEESIAVRVLDPAAVHYLEY